MIFQVRDKLIKFVSSVNLFIQLVYSVSNFKYADETSEIPKRKAKRQIEKKRFSLALVSDYNLTFNRSVNI